MMRIGIQSVATSGQAEVAWNWGLLGPERLVSERRTRTLGVAAAIRAFNDLAVPGMGNVFFGKQLVLAIMGIHLAQRLRADGVPVKNIETANAVEALACWLALDASGWESDPRLRGSTKLRGPRHEPTFAEARKRSFYVTAPMRMVTVQPLFALGLAESESERFNAYHVAQGGMDLLESLSAIYGHSYHKMDIHDHLLRWAKGSARVAGNSPLASAISPTVVLSRVPRVILRDCLERGDHQAAGRRRAILRWVERLASSSAAAVSWSEIPEEVDASHWADLHAGVV